jgi:hypothetical protein
MKKFVFLIAHSCFFAFGVVQFLVRGVNSQRAHRALIYLFCASGGHFNAWCSRIMSLAHKPLRQPLKKGILGDMDADSGESALRQLKEKGYVVFEKAIAPEVCERLMSFAMGTPANIRPMDGEEKQVVPRTAYYSPEAPVAVRYDYKTEDLLSNADVQDVMADPSMLALAEAYLDACPKLDVVSMWWHTRFHSKGDSEAAQFYHFDMDRVKWLKVFIYLTDVGPEDGPHAFIEGSHQDGGIPQHFLDRGYVRVMDEEVLAHYGERREVRFAAPRGTVIIEDTRGLHKGSPVTGNPRLLLQMQFSNSLFGVTYPKAYLPQRKSPALTAQMSRFPDVYEAYL